MCIRDSPKDGLEIQVSAAQYRSQPPADPESRRTQEWRRFELDLAPQRLTVNPSLTKEIKPFPLVDGLELRVIYKRLDDGIYLLTLTLINMNVGNPNTPIRAANCFYQVGLSVQAKNKSPVFKEYKLLGKISETDEKDLDQLEEAVLELLYSKRRAFAVGHGTSVTWSPEVDDHVERSSTSTIPSVKVPPAEPRNAGGNELSMFFLSGADGAVRDDDIVKSLNQLSIDYESWIDERKNDLDELPKHLGVAAKSNLEKCRTCLKRIKFGIELLARKEQHNLLRAFKFANKAILMQQLHSRRPKRATNQPLADLPPTYQPTDEKGGRWRTFQLAFILMNLASITPKPDGTDHSERELVDLIWFPTGGGKTEAYLGLAATNIFLRRLNRPSNGGCTVLMRVYAAVADCTAVPTCQLHDMRLRVDSSGKY